MSILVMVALLHPHQVGAGRRGTGFSAGGEPENYQLTLGFHSSGRAAMTWRVKTFEPQRELFEGFSGKEL